MYNGWVDGMGRGKAVEDKQNDMTDSWVRADEMFIFIQKRHVQMCCSHTSESHTSVRPLK